MQGAYSTERRSSNVPPSDERQGGKANVNDANARETSSLNQSIPWKWQDAHVQLKSIGQGDRQNRYKISSVCVEPSESTQLRTDDVEKRHYCSSHRAHRTSTYNTNCTPYTSTLWRQSSERTSRVASFIKSKKQNFYKNRSRVRSSL